MECLTEREAWTDGRRTLYAGDCRDILPHLEKGSFSGLVTDPPYGAGVLEHGDDTPSEAADLLGRVLTMCVPLLEPGAHAAIFWGNIGLDLALDAARYAGLQYSRLLLMHTPQGNARPYLGWLPRTQPILLMRVPGRKIPAWRLASCEAIRVAMSNLGYSVEYVAGKIGCSGRLVYKWFREDDPAWSYPSEEHRAKLREILGVDLGPAPETVGIKERHDLYEVTSGSAETSHPCEKPLSIIRDIMERIGGRILDPFCGSGTVLEAARISDLEAVGIEIDPEHVGRAVERLRQKRLAF